MVLTDIENPVFERGVRRRLVSADTTFVSIHGDPSRAVFAAKRRSRPDVIVDATRQGDRTALAREMIWVLPRGGLYIAVGARRSWTNRFDAAGRSLSTDSVASERVKKELRDSVSLERNRRPQAVVKQRDHLAVLRHTDVEEVLSSRYGAAWGEIVTRQAEYTFESRADLIMHGEPSEARKPSTIHVPELTVRAYNDATCHMREILTRNDFILPDTYRHWQNKSLLHKRIQPGSRSYARLLEAVTAGRAKSEAGTFYSLDSAFPTHFGHLMTETISRHWGWQVASKMYPDLRPVMTRQAGKAPLPQWKRDVLSALNVPLDKILFVEEGDSVRVERLVAAMPQLVNPRYIDAGIHNTWAAIGAGVGVDPTPLLRPEKIFLSRRSKSQRTCSNTPEVESFFAQNGFKVLLPEKLSFAEQVHTFAAAKVIAGFGGSALFNAMFNSTAKILILTSRSYVAANEYLIASVNGNELHYFWAPPELQQPPSGFSVDAYRSGFEFPLAQHQAALMRVI
ncbi:glycosyltransferase family 61 protein [Aeromicrobium yanjiei]|uniref:DUF563 domain-containing protein n=1 Tax=Aeromicrobium yanjiei TaxID=2662028 RepID=A0A5Q2M9Y8_9ACTN|nr:glycosyltransferase 61 family protein [Aeromicrobium yanjiei]QGG39924.1 DUF563 domain-containing protein [Aeromicrobium yanjiei]